MKRVRTVLAVCAILVLCGAAVAQSGREFNSGMNLGYLVDDSPAASSNTALVYGLWGPRTQGGMTPRSAGTVYENWQTTQSLVLGETTHTLYRHPALETLQVWNWTTYTLYLEFNCTKALSDESTATVGPNNWTYQLRAYNSGYPFSVRLDREDAEDRHLFPIYNVGVYAYYADVTAAETAITSQTIRVQGR